jgi:hypothetical protein
MASKEPEGEVCAKCGDHVQRVCVGCELPEDECDCAEQAEEGR